MIYRTIQQRGIDNLPGSPVLPLFQGFHVTEQRPPWLVLSIPFPSPDPDVDQPTDPTARDGGTCRWLDCLPEAARRVAQALLPEGSLVHPHRQPRVGSHRV